MARRGHSGRSRRNPKPAAQAPNQPVRLNAPFSALRRDFTALPRPRVTPPERRPAPIAAPASDDPGLFARAMEGVSRLPPEPHARVSGPRPSGTPRRPRSDEAEAMAVLSDLISGTARFDITETREYVEGAVVGIDPRLVRRLRNGDFARQAHLDLHGLTTAAARPAVERFLADAVRRGLRCVVVVHGRGLNSKDRAPVLKEGLKQWLSRGPNARLVLAFATARPFDGGGGALYVLLRRDRRRRPIEIIEGAAR